MSIIADLGKDKKGLADIIGTYEAAIDGFEINLEIKGKRLEIANREQPGWYSYYDQRRVELYALVKYMDGQVNSVRGGLFRGYTENYSRDLSDRAKDKYIDNEDAFIHEVEIYLEIKELYDRYDAVVEAFKMRGYALNNITKIRVAALEDVAL